MKLQSNISTHVRILSILLLMFFISCKKSIDNTPNVTNPGTTDTTNNTVPQNQAPDLTTRANASVSGFVTNENNTAVEGASVKFGDVTVSTDHYGHFEINNVSVIKLAAVVTVTKADYFNGIKTFAVTEGKPAFFRIKLIPKDYPGTITAAAGGTINIGNGATLTIPADAVVHASDNSPYSNAIVIATAYINPEATDLNQIMPGDLRAIDSNGIMKGLTTYGMAGVELTDVSGQPLKIASGKKATISFPLSATYTASAPATIPLWYFDEVSGLWKEDGSATKNGNSYVGDVSHFTFWNCDIPNAIVPLNFTVVNNTGVPVANALVIIRPLNGVGATGGNTTDGGYVSVFVAQNTTYTLEIYSECNFGTNSPNYSQTFSVGTTAVSLGNVVVSASELATISGTLTDCNNVAVTNGYVILRNTNYDQRVNVDNTGSYSFTTLLCNGSMNVNLIGHNSTTSLESTAQPFTIVSGNNTVGNIQACAVSGAEFLHYTIDGVMTQNYDAPTDSIYNGFENTPFMGSVIAFTSPDYTHFTQIDIMPDAGYYFTTSFQMPNNTYAGFANPTVMTITEMGNVGDFMAGSFTGTVTASAPPYDSHTITCSFRVRRAY